MTKLPNQPLRGMVDEFPFDYRYYTWIKSKIDEVARRFCYHEYDLPILEPLSLYTTGEGATNDEIYHRQAYTFDDKGGRQVILRPEMTRSLARMASRVIGRGEKPLRWYSVGKCYRYERPQKGRLREFKQLNVDALGRVPFREAEIIGFVVALMDAFRVNGSDYQILYNDRRLVEALLRKHDFSDNEKQHFYRVVDRASKEGASSQLIKEHFLTKQRQDFVWDFMNRAMTREPPESFCEYWKIDLPQDSLHGQMKFFHMKRIRFEPRIVRGLDYYTGFVFEVFASDSDGLAIGRSLFGGGSYSNLIKPFANDDAEGIGFGMGIDILKLFLDRLGLLPKKAEWNESFCVVGAKKYGGALLRLAAALRRDKKAVEVVELASGQFMAAINEAERRNHRYLLFLGEDEIEKKKVVVRDLKERRDSFVYKRERDKREGDTWRRAKTPPIS